MAEKVKEYIIQRIETDDDEFKVCLFSLSCYSGEPITVIAHRKRGCTVFIKGGRYNIDNQWPKRSSSDNGGNAKGDSLISFCLRVSDA